MKYKIGELTFFIKTYSEKHRSCHLCEIVKEYPESKKYLVLCYDYYVVGHYYFSIVYEKDLLPISESFLSSEFQEYKPIYNGVIKSTIINIYEENKKWIEFLNSKYDSYEEFIKKVD